MDEEALAKAVRASFAEEIEGHARALQRDAMQLERVADDARPELLHVLFRTLHTVKGAARAAGMDLVDQASHGRARGARRRGRIRAH